jgi:tetratricopeptide (TPR) repeat protein
LTVASVSSPSFYPQALDYWGDALYAMACVHANQKRNERALEMLELAASKFEAALKLDPRDSGTLRGLGDVRYMQATLMCAAGQVENAGFLVAVRQMQSMFMRSSGNVEKAGPYYEQAVDCFRRALKVSPRDKYLKQALKKATEEGAQTYPRQFHQMPAAPPMEKELEHTEHHEEGIVRAKLNLQANPADSEVRAPGCRGSETPRSPVLACRPYYSHTAAALLLSGGALAHCMARRETRQVDAVAAGGGSSVYPHCARRSTLTSVGHLTVACLSSPSFRPQALHNWGQALCSMAGAHLTLGGNDPGRNKRAWEMHELAAPKFEAALELDPRNSVTLRCLGLVRQMQSIFLCAAGQVEKAGPYYEQAVDCFRRGLKVSPRDKALKEALKISLEEGRPRWPRDYSDFRTGPGSQTTLNSQLSILVVSARAYRGTHTGPSLPLIVFCKNIDDSCKL